MSAKKHTTLRDIAEIFGVSIPTVSRALKDSPEISHQLKLKIQKAAREMNYYPNPFATSLKHNTPHIIGVIIPDLEEFFFVSALNGMEEMARKNGYFLIIATSHEQYELEVRAVKNMRNMRVEGIIACVSAETQTFGHFEDLHEIGMPTVFYDRTCLPKLFSSVVADNAQSAQRLTQHLIDSGRRRVAFIGGANHVDIVKHRKHGYAEALRDNDIPIRREYVVCHNLTYQGGREAMEILLGLPEPPNAVVAMTDLLTFGALDIVREHNLSIPDDIIVAGYVDRKMSRIPNPHVPAMAHRTKEMGETAVKLLIESIKGAKKSSHIMVPMEFIK